MWRRDKLGSLVCNACGLYIKLYGINRPINMRKDTIRSVGLTKLRMVLKDSNDR